MSHFGIPPSTVYNLPSPPDAFIILMIISSYFNSVDSLITISSTDPGEEGLRLLASTREQPLAGRLDENLGRWQPRLKTCQTCRGGRLDQVKK